MSESRKESTLRPFSHRVFAVMWAAALISNIGTWMHSVGASWLMTDLAPSPLYVALVQTATTLPVFIFALPAGALADIFNRRQLLLITNITMLFGAFGFALLVHFELVNAASLLFFTVILGIGTTFMAPAWQAIIPSMVPKEDLPQAVALGGISINLSRAVGPALAGLLISVFGIASPFIANALSFMAIIYALLWWKLNAITETQNLPPERVWSAMKTGLRYAFHNQALKATMWHVFGFMFFANAFWGLLPLIAKEQLQGSSAYFGILMGSVGVGAVSGAFLLPYLRMRLSANQLVTLGSAGTALITASFAIATHQLLALLASLIFGISWIFVLASVNVSAQQALPNWVRARGLAVFMMVFFGSMSLGTTFWGWLAQWTSIKVAMLSAAAGGLAFIALSQKSKLQQGKDLNLAPSNHWPDPVVHEGVSYEAGPVIIQIRYIISETKRAAFLNAIYRLKEIRLRDGAQNWGVYEDTENRNHFIEHFMEDCWAEHLRHHHRVTESDKPLQAAVIACHTGDKPPQVAHFLAVPLNKHNPPQHL